MTGVKVDLVKCISNGENYDLINFTNTSKGVFVFVKPGMIRTVTQLQICYDAAMRIRKRNTRYRDAGAVMLMLISGKSQISEAIQDAGIRENEKEFIVAFDEKSDLENFRKRFSVSVSEDTGIPDDDSNLDSTILPSITDIIYELDRSHER